MLTFGIALFTGLCAGAFIGWFLNLSKYQKSAVKTQTLLKKENEEKHKWEQEAKALQAKYIQSEKQLSELQAESKIRQTWKEQFTNHFKTLSQEILDSKSKQFQIQAEQNLSGLLSPLKEKITSFQKKVEDSYNQEERERFSLKDKIKDLCQVHDRLKEETIRLSKALTGDVKAQGQWGEMILSALLSASGLKENEHYITQGKGFDLKDKEGKRQKPDVIIKLPEGKHIIIDSKVSLTHYERFISSGTEEEKQKYLNLFTTSLRSHIKQLHEKQYSRNNTLNTPDFVLMFFPVEGAFSLALQSDPQIFPFSWDLSIVVVSPTTLLATLKTVESIWKREKQSKNALEIAEAGGRLYDKFVLFAEDLCHIGESLKKAEGSYMTALQKLKTGKGNIISRLEKIKHLGAKASKQMPEDLRAAPLATSEKAIEPASSYKNSVT